jgi:hypothetical protein
VGGRGVVSHAGHPRPQEQRPSKPAKLRQMARWMSRSKSPRSSGRLQARQPAQAGPN